MSIVSIEDQRNAVVDLILAECRHQEEKGFSAEHDDEHREGELAAAAATYAMIGEMAQCETGARRKEIADRLWPWTNRCPQPGAIDPRTALVRAGALIVAELARLERRDTQDLRNAIVDALKSSAETRQRLGFTDDEGELDQVPARRDRLRATLDPVTSAMEDWAREVEAESSSLGQFLASEIRRRVATALASNRKADNE